MTRVMLIDDHAIVRLGMRSLLETRDDMRVVAEAGSRGEALELLHAHEGTSACPDVAVVDLVLGADDGLEFIKELSHLRPDMDILVVTMQDEAVYADRVLKAGARGFLQKRDATRHLPDAIRTIRDGEVFVGRASRARIFGDRLREDEKGNATAISGLSDRELHVFQLIGTGLGNKQIAAHLGLSTKTIETYKENLKRKLDKKNVEELRQAAESWVVHGEI